MNKLTLVCDDPNVVTQVQLFAQANNLSLEVQSGNVVALPTSGQQVKSVAEMECELIQSAIVACKGNLSEAAKTLKIGRATLYRKVKEYSLSTKEHRKAA